MAPSKFNQGLAIFSIVGLVLVFALAYNIGSTSEDSRSVKMGALTRKRMDIAKERLNMCLDNKRDMKNGRYTKETLLQHLRDTNDRLSQESTLFREQNQEGRAALKECQTKLAVEREDHTGTKESNATQMLEHLQEQHEWLEKSIKQANTTRELKRDEIKQLILAYKFENMALQQKLTDMLAKKAAEKAELLARKKAEREVERQARLAAKEAAKAEEAEKAAEQAAKALRAAELAAKAQQLAQAAVKAQQDAEEAAKSKVDVKRKASADEGGEDETPKETPKPKPAKAAPGKPRRQISGTTCPALGKRYGVVFDAGSTGSRVHIFEFDVQPNGTKLLREVFKSLKPGLSSYPDDPEAAVNSLAPLLAAANKEVPKNYSRCTPISLKATAGLRLLGAEKSSAILSAVQDTFSKKTRFAVPPEAAIVMDSKDEGPYAWLTVNSLLETLAPGKKTAAILDMGGGSTQIVFVPDDASALDDAPKENLYVTKVNGVTFRAYQHSYLGLGLKEATKSVVKAAAASAANSFACFPPDHNETVGDVVVKTESGKQAFAKCRKFISEVLFKKTACPYKQCAIGGVFQPKLTETFSGPIYAFSFFYDRMESHLPENGEITVGEYKRIGKLVCESSGDDVAAKNKGTMCMDLAFLYSMLTDGYSLPDSQPLFIKKKVNGVETAWPLGAAISEMRL